MTTAPSHPGQAAQAAGIVTRTLAAVVDGGVVVAMMGATLVLVAGLRFFVSPTTFQWPSPSWPQSLAVGVLLAIAYLTVGWATSGRSFGGAVLGLRVSGMGGRPLGWVRSLVRAALCVLFPVGLLWCGISRRRLSLQDLLLRSVVVYDEGMSVIRNG